MPLGGGVFHPSWSQHHRPTARSTMTAACDITRTGGDGALNPDGTWSPADPTNVYSGPCRITPMSLSAAQLDTAGDRQSTLRRYTVAVPYDVPEIHVGDIIELTGGVDPGLVGLKLRASDVRYASEQWQRDLVADETETGE